MSNWPVLPTGSSLTSSSPCDVRLDLPARANQVVLARHIMAALAESLRFPVAMVEDVKLAVTEACTNVVRHAYTEDEGRLQVAAAAADGELVVSVMDEGHGLRPVARPPDAIGGMGLPLMAALTQDLAIEQGGTGTTVRMSFAASE